jgi:hypothetical protein
MGRVLDVEEASERIEDVEWRLRALEEREARVKEVLDRLLPILTQAASLFPGLTLLVEEWEE